MNRAISASFTFRECPSHIPDDAICRYDANISRWRVTFNRAPAGNISVLDRAALFFDFVANARMMDCTPDPVFELLVDPSGARMLPYQMITNGNHDYFVFVMPLRAGAMGVRDILFHLNSYLP